MATLPDPTTLLAQAQAARHALLTGAQAVKVDVGTHKTEFTPANRDALESYIAELEAQISGQKVRGAIGIVF